MDSDQLRSILDGSHNLQEHSREDLLNLSAQVFSATLKDEFSSGLAQEAYETIAQALNVGPVEYELATPAERQEVLSRHIRNQRDQIGEQLNYFDILASERVSKKGKEVFSGSLSQKAPLLINKLNTASSSGLREELDFLNYLTHLEQTSPDFQQQLKHTDPHLLSRWNRTTEDRINFLKNKLRVSVLAGKPETKDSSKVVLRVSHDYNRNTGGLQQHLQQLNKALADNHGIAIHQVLPMAHVDLERLLQQGELTFDSDSGIFHPESGVRIHPILLEGSEKDRMVRLNDPLIVKQYNKQIKDIIDRVNPSVVHVHNGYYQAHVNAANMAKARGIPLVHTWHGGSIRKKSLLDRHRRVEGLADVNLAISNKGAQSFGDSDQVGVAYGVDLSRFDPDNVSESDIQRARELSGVEDGDFVYFFPGRYHEQKNQLGLVRAFSEVAREDPHVKLVLAGQKFDDQKGSLYLQRIQTEIHRLGIEDRVKLLDAIKSPDDMRSLYAMSDAVVYASKNEGRGRSLVEAMHMRKPVIASNDAGLADSVKDGETGLLINPDNIVDISDKLKLLRDQPEKRVSLANRAHIHAKENLSIDSYASQLAQVYEGVKKVA